MAWPHPPLKLFVNFGTSAMTPANGSTEVWPGSHLLTASAGRPLPPLPPPLSPLPSPDARARPSDPLAIDIIQGAGPDPGKPIDEALIEPRRASHPPAQVVVPKGGAVFRDLRMWVRRYNAMRIAPARAIPDP